MEQCIRWIWRSPRAVEEPTYTLLRWRYTGAGRIATTPTTLCPTWQRRGVHLPLMCWMLCLRELRKLSLCRNPSVYLQVFEVSNITSIGLRGNVNGPCICWVKSGSKPRRGGFYYFSLFDNIVTTARRNQNWASILLYTCRAVQASNITSTDH